MTDEDKGRILIVDSERLFADALGREVTNAGFTVVELCRTVDLAATYVAEHDVDVVLVDPEVDGGDDETAYALLSENPSVRLILMSATLDYDRISRAVALGFRGVVSKDVRLARLIETITSVVRGNVAIEPPVRMHDPSANRRHVGEPVGRLTPREREVLGLLAEAATSAGIAERLALSPHTVRTHINNVMHKLGVHSRSEAVAAAVRLGLISTGTYPRPPSSSSEVA